MSNVEITVIVPTYNRSQLLQYTLQSIKDQSFPNKSMEIIVVDDGSADNTKEIVDRFRGSLSLKYFFQEDVGYRVATARNIGIENATGSIVLFVDSGIILTRDCIAAHVTSHRENPYNKIVIGYIYFIDDIDSSYKDLLLSKAGLEQSIKDFVATGNHLDYRESNYNACNHKINLLPAPWVLCWTGNVSMKTEMTKGINKFDSMFDFNWGMEDIDLGFRLFKEGATFVVNKSAASVHYPHFSNSASKLDQEKINKIYFHKKHNCHESEVLLNCKTIDLNFLLGIKPNKKEK